MHLQYSLGSKIENIDILVATVLLDLLLKKFLENSEGKFETIPATRKDANLLSLTETKNFYIKNSTEFNYK